jgi:hypothetical protein
VQLNISYPANGSQKLIDIEDERKVAVFMEKRVRSDPEQKKLFLSCPNKPPIAARFMPWLWNKTSPKRLKEQHGRVPDAKNTEIDRNVC